MRIIIKVTSQILTNVLAMNNLFKGCWNFSKFCYLEFRKSGWSHYVFGFCDF